MKDSAVRPQHYRESKIEPIDAIEAWDLGFNLGNVCKYIARAGKRDIESRLNDLSKAQWYLAREIQIVASAQGIAVEVVPVDPLK